MRQYIRWYKYWGNQLGCVKCIFTRLDVTNSLTALFDWFVILLLEALECDTTYKCFIEQAASNCTWYWIEWNYGQHGWRVFRRERRRGNGQTAHIPVHHDWDAKVSRNLFVSIDYRARVSLIPDIRFPKFSSMLVSFFSRQFRRLCTPWHYFKRWPNQNKTTKPYSS